MNFNLIKRSFATTLLLSIITSTGSALAYKPISDWEPNPINPKVCGCGQPPIWETKIKKPIYCPLRSCPDFKTSSLQTILQVDGISESGITKTHDLIAIGGDEDRGRSFGSRFRDLLRDLGGVANPIGSDRPDRPDRPTGAGGGTAEQRERNRESGHRGHGGPL